MNSPTATVGIYTLGCKVNQYESEAISEELARRGLLLRSADEACDLYIINTCTVTSESDRKARQFIRRALSHNPRAFVLVTGCFAQIDAPSIAAIPGVDYICGNKSKMKIVEKAMQLLTRGIKNNQPEIDVPSLDGASFESMEIHQFARTRAYIKIEDGCESHCTYCIIPSARGSIRSKPKEEVLREAEILTRNGCKEIVLTGIETASWGKDLEGHRDLADLLVSIDKINGIGRIRLGSLDPSLMRQPFVDQIAGLKNLAPHFHLSMQSGSDHILALMKRKYNHSQALEAIERVRTAIPQVQFTTDMIVGFPGETEEDFEKTMEFARKARFLMIHVFPYSRRPGTLADKMPQQIPEEIKHARVGMLTTLAANIRQEILTEKIAAHIPVDVLFESFDEKTHLATGHTPDFVEVTVPSCRPLHAEYHRVSLEKLTADNNGCTGKIIDMEEV